MALSPTDFTPYTPDHPIVQSHMRRARYAMWRAKKAPNVRMFRLWQNVVAFYETELLLLMDAFDCTYPYPIEDAQAVLRAHAPAICSHVVPNPPL